MVAVEVGPEARNITIVRYGVIISERFELDSGILIEPNVPTLDMQAAAAGSRQFGDKSLLCTFPETAPTIDPVCRALGITLPPVFQELPMAARSQSNN